MERTGIPLTDQERDAVATVCLMAARVDGLSDEERERLKQVFGALGGIDTATLYGRVLLGRTEIAETAEALGTPGLRLYAFEMAVGVCDADGHTTPKERAFLDELAAHLAVPSPEADAVREQAEALADAPQEKGEPAADTSETSETQGDGTVGEASDLERKILNRSVLAGALELLPQSLATMAIVPVQMKTVHEIGRAHGYTLDAGSARELLAIAGVGMTSQVLEGYARKLFGGILRKTAGKGASMVGRTATGALMTFATTYGIGKVADSYYGGGRTLDRDELRRVFEDQLERGKALFDRYQGEVQDKASTTKLSDLTRLVRR